MTENNTPLSATSLLGHWLHILDGEYCKCGQITMVVGTDHYLVRLRLQGEAMLPISQLMMTDDFCDNDDHHVAIFATEAELDAWLKWIDEPPHGDDDGRPRIVSMRKN
jgi:hypothetical protein